MQMRHLSTGNPETIQRIISVPAFKGPEMVRSKSSRSRRPANLSGTLSRPAGVVKRSKISPRSNNKYTSAIAKAERSLTATDEYLQTGLTQLGEAKSRELQAYLHNFFTPSDAAVATWKRRVKDVTTIRPLVMGVIKRRKTYSSTIAQLKANDLKFAKHLKKSADDIIAAKYRLAYCEDAVNHHTQILSMHATPIARSTLKMETDYITKHADEAAGLTGVIEVLEESYYRLVTSSKRESQDEDGLDAQARDQRPTPKILALAEIDRLFDFWERLCEHGERAAQISARRAKYANIKHLLTDFENESRRLKRDLTHILRLRDQVKEEIQTSIGVLYGKGYVGGENPRRIVEIHNAISERSAKLTPAPKSADTPSPELETGAGAGMPQAPAPKATVREAVVPPWVRRALIDVQAYLDQSATQVVEKFNALLDAEVQKSEDLEKQLTLQNEKWEQEENAQLELIEAEEELTGSRDVQPGSRLFRLRAARLQSHYDHERVVNDQNARIDISSKMQRTLDILLRYYRLRGLNNLLMRNLLLLEADKWTDETNLNIRSIYTDLKRLHKLEEEWASLYKDYQKVEHPGHGELLGDLAMYVQEWENLDHSDKGLPALATLSLLQVQEFEQVIAAAREVDKQYKEYRA